MEVLLDSNVLVSAAISRGGTAFQILEHWRAGRFRLLVCAHVLEETRRALLRPAIVKKYQTSPELVDTYVRDLAMSAEWAPGELVLAGAVRHKSDVPVVSAAVESHADYLVSSNHHLLDLEAFQGVRILHPRDFLALLQSAPGMV